MLRFCTTLYHLFERIINYEPNRVKLVITKIPNIDALFLMKEEKNNIIIKSFILPQCKSKILFLLRFKN